MKKTLHYFFVGSLLFLAGCGGSDSGNTIARWSADTFKQAKQIDAHFAKVMQQYVRSSKVYQGLQSLVSFSAVCMTDEAQKEYASYYGKIHFSDEQDIAMMQEKLLRENKYYVTFYVIGSQPAVLFETNKSLFKGQYRTNSSQLLGKKDTTWQIALHVGGKTYHPDTITTNNFPVEMKTAFGPLYNQFKAMYVVKFALPSPEFTSVMRGKKEDIRLAFISYQYELFLDWKNTLYGDLLKEVQE